MHVRCLPLSLQGPGHHEPRNAKIYLDGKNMMSKMQPGPVGSAESSAETAKLCRPGQSLTWEPLSRASMHSVQQLTSTHSVVASHHKVTPEGLLQAAFSCHAVHQALRSHPCNHVHALL